MPDNSSQLVFADTSLDDRKAVLLKALEAYKFAEESLELVKAETDSGKKTELLDALGAIEEIQSALDASKKTLLRALVCFSENEFQALELSRDELHELIAVKRYEDLHRKHFDNRGHELE